MRGDVSFVYLHPRTSGVGSRGFVCGAFQHVKPRWPAFVASEGHRLRGICDATHRCAPIEAGTWTVILPTERRD